MYLTTEGKLPFANFSTWYTITGDGDKTPLLTLHGGPGSGSDYLHSLDRLSEDGRKIIYYDQLGCGRSPADSDPSRWTISFFIEELKAVVAALGLKSFHLFGQSWGAFLAIQYAAQQPKELKSLILANPPVDWRLWDTEMIRLASEMPAPYGEILKRAAETGKEDDPAYPEAYTAFFRKHWIYCPQQTEIPCDVPTEVNFIMERSVALHTTGSLRDADITPLLPSITVPTLVLSGEYDICTKVMIEKVMTGLSSAKAILLKDSGHIPNADAPEALNKAIRDFFSEIESR